MDNNETLNSCLMLAIGLYTPVDLGYIFDESDLKDTGIEIDSHITLLYAQGRTIDHKGLLDDISNILDPADVNKFFDSIKDDGLMKVSDMFDLGSFQNDSDYVVLKLKKDTEMFKFLTLLNKSLKIRHDISSSFKDYIPHVTLAELNPGCAEKYMSSETLRKVLEDSAFNFEDLFISYGYSNEPGDRKQYWLTQYKNVDRYFRLSRLRS